MLVSPGTAIATLDDTSVIKLDFDIAESQMPKMKKGVPLIAHTAAFPNREFLGKIDQVDSRVNTTTRTVRVRALLPNPTGVLKPGMLMTVEVRSGESESLAVPEVSLSEVGDQVSVYRVSRGQGAPRLEQVNIGVGRRQDGMVEVLSGLAANDPIVTSGVVQARAGQPVRISEGGQAAGGARNGGQGAGQGAGQGGAEGAARREGARRTGQRPGQGG
jgi:membrane fusion protein (multidrug efflux system)